MSEYWDDYAGYDEAAETLKEALRAGVKDEIKEQIKSLSSENRELKNKLKNLDKLMLEAEQSRLAYEREYATAKRTAVQDVRKEKLAELLNALDERLYTVERIYVSREKCDRCDDQRRIYYTTPMGRETYEACECSSSDSHWEAVSVAAHEVSRRDGKLVLWWCAVDGWRDSDTLNPKVLKPSGGVDIAVLTESPSSYSFRTLESAQAVADARNRQEKGEAVQS